MEIRKLRAKEHKDTRALYEEIFAEDSQSFVDYYYTEKTKDNQIYVVEEDGAIQAMLHLNPYTLMVNRVGQEAAYIVAVATRREYRKRGFMAALLRRALLDMYAGGHVFTFLMPAAEEIYLPYGFRTVYRQERIFYKGRGNPAASGGGIPGKEGIEAALAGAEDAKELAEAAEKHLSRDRQIYARRDEAYYLRLIKEMGSDNGGLILFRKGKEIVDCQFFYKDQEEPAEKPKIMMRVVDVRRMLMSMGLKTLMAACFTVEDPIIEENSRCLMVTGTEFSGVMVMDGKRENSEGHVTIAALASFLFGAKSVEDICEEEHVEMSGRLKEELKKLIPLSRIYLNEVV